MPASEHTHPGKGGRGRGRAGVPIAMVTRCEMALGYLPKFPCRRLAATRSSRGLRTRDPARGTRASHSRCTLRIAHPTHATDTHKTHADTCSRQTRRTRTPRTHSGPDSEDARWEPAPQLMHWPAQPAAGSHLGPCTSQKHRKRGPPAPHFACRKRWHSHPRGPWLPPGQCAAGRVQGSEAVHVGATGAFPGRAFMGLGIGTAPHTRRVPRSPPSHEVAGGDT